jgi:excisionase family DNA binding protein
MPEYVTTLEAADISGYNPEYIRQLIRAGVISAEKRGRDWWIDREAFTAYLESAQSKSKDRRHGPRTSQP